jgi:release factor glutamine methyltransferase
MKQKIIHWLGLPLRKTVKWYLSRPRSFRYQQITASVPSGVFHPGFFFSTKLLLEYLETQLLEGKTFLELGSGSGVISVLAAKKGAIVTACDINSKAVAATLLNSKNNKVVVDVIASDLFQNIRSRFDWMVINPPYYNADPQKEEDYAWYCGKEYEYFERFFERLSDHIHPRSKVLMILSEVCNLEKIFAIAKSRGFSFDKILERKVWADGKNYLYWIKSDRLS